MRIVTVTLLCLFAAGPLRSQPETDHRPELVFTSEVELVLLDVGVKNARGAFVAGLTRENFTIHENGSLQTIKVFAPGDQPVSVGLVIDTSGSMKPRIQEVIAASLRFAEASNPLDEFFVVHFNDRVSFGLPLSTPFTDNRGLLRSALLRNRAEGRTAFYDGARSALGHLARARHGRKALVMIGDGADNASATSREELVRLAGESLATIYAIGIQDPADQERDPRFLQRLSRLTGGEALFPATPAQLTNAIEKIAGDLRSRYTIGIAPLDTRLDGTVRKLRVDVAAPGAGKLTVQTRDHYVAAPLGTGRAGSKP
jgi:Ca-activated chloride channel homolog